MTPCGEGRVLVVDDDIDVADAYASQLRERYDVETAYSGEAALSMLDSSIDVVLLDRRMPGISGDEVLETIRERGLSTRVAMVTAVDPGFDIIEMPFDDYVEKPVSRDTLFSTIDRLQRCSAYQDQLREYYALTAKQAALTARKSEAELAANEEFHSLETAIEAAESSLHDIVAGFEETDYERVFADFADPVNAGQTD
ncbi:response regulator transcription factor [Haloarcula sp. JP-L23]|uniref:response regulator transcription factor n=1 Tax=Haloarcula sp. JP-L23 TaxID=2716717 RepID=UPI00140F4133|nr:response regulator [Haloarcula sp. JP-L23]